MFMGSHIIIDRGGEKEKTGKKGIRFASAVTKPLNVCATTTGGSELRPDPLGGGGGDGGGGGGGGGDFPQ